MNFLVGYDSSQVSLNAVEEAKKYAKKLDAKLYILTTIPYNPKDPERKEIEDELENLKNTLVKDGADCEINLIGGTYKAGEHLLDFARRHTIELIFVGIKRKSKLNKFIVGSTAQYVILEANCPVVTVK